MKVDIQPQWKKLANWYWDSLKPGAVSGMSIWEMLEQEYGMVKDGSMRDGYWVVFPDEKSYTAFLLRWS